MLFDCSEGENFLEFEERGDHMLEIPELKNIMVFYIEQGNFFPMEDIIYIPEVAKVDREYPERLVGMTKEKWFTLRNPYLKREDEGKKADKAGADTDAETKVTAEQTGTDTPPQPSTSDKDKSPFD